MIIKNPHQVSAIAEINENGIYNTWKISVPKTIRIISIIPIVNATTKPGIKAENELATTRRNRCWHLNTPIVFNAEPVHLNC